MMISKPADHEFVVSTEQSDVQVRVPKLLMMRLLKVTECNQTSDICDYELHNLDIDSFRSMAAMMGPGRFLTSFHEHRSRTM